MEIEVRGKKYSLDGLLPLTWKHLKEARKAGLLPATPTDDTSASDGTLLYILQKVCPDATMDDVDGLRGGVATRILREAYAENPLGTSSPSATSSD